MKRAYDIGGYDGSDTAHYLELGYNVVCVEASPDLAKKITEKFAGEIRDGRCVVLNIGVGNAEGTLPFYLSRNPIWNSFDREMAARAGAVLEVAVPMRRLADVITEYGSPEFVKIDVEGADYACLQSLAGSAHHPKYLSCEASHEHGAEMVMLLTSMGFDKFNLIRQDSFAPARIPQPGGLASVAWAARQWIRSELRKRPWIHRTLARLKPSQEGSLKNDAGVAAYAIDSAGPTPMEFKGEWYSPAAFVWLWQNVVLSGMVDSVWWDIHAASSQVRS